MKMLKVYDKNNNDDNDDGQRRNFDQKSSLEPSAQLNLKLLFGNHLNMSFWKPLKPLSQCSWPEGEGGLRSKARMNSFTRLLSHGVTAVDCLQFHKTPWNNSKLKNSDLAPFWIQTWNTLFFSTDSSFIHYTIVMKGLNKTIFIYMLEASFAEKSHLLTLCLELSLMPEIKKTQLLALCSDPKQIDINNYTLLYFIWNFQQLCI